MSGRNAQFNSISERGVENKLQANRTVTLSPSMSSSEIQEIINSQPKDLNGYTLEFRFEDGEYTITTELRFYAFNNGVLHIYGNTSEGDGASTSQAVHLNASNCVNDHPVYILRCNSSCFVRNIKVTIRDIVNHTGIIFHECRRGECIACYIIGLGKTAINYGPRFFYTSGLIRNTYVSNVDRGCWVDRGRVVVDNLLVTGTAPSYWLGVTEGGFIRKNGPEGAYTVAPYRIDGNGQIPYTTNTTYTIPTTMNDAQRQEVINSLPKDLNAKVISVVFANGTHTFNSTLHFNNYYNGIFHINGNSNDVNGLSTAQSVHLNGTSSTQSIIVCERCMCFLHIRWLKITCPNIVNTSGLFIGNGSNSNLFEYSYIVGVGKTTTNHGIHVHRARAHVINCNFSNTRNGIHANDGMVRSQNNASTGTAPDYGLAASMASIIGKLGTQPSGTIANEHGSYIK